MIIHTIPFTNLIFALGVLHVAIAWFGTNIAWKDLMKQGHLPMWYAKAVWIHAIIFQIVSGMKVVIQVNGLADMDDGNGKGLFWSVHVEENGKRAKAIDVVFMVMSLIIPTFQCAHLGCFLRGKTHAVILSFEDNRPAIPLGRYSQHRMPVSPVLESE
jgi:hypothetical protein